MDFIDRLKRGEIRIGCCVTYPSPGTVERLGADWDWFWIDGQHGQLGYADVLALVRACDLVQRPAVIRVASLEFGAIGLALDTGAAGVIVPLVDTPEQARACVRAAKFPPLGGRSFGGRRPIDRGGRVYVDTANADTLLIAQVESPEAVRCADAIAAVEGIDALFFGPDDITLRRGQPMETPSTRDALREDATAVAEACRRHGKVAVTVAMTAEMQSFCRDVGYGMIVCGADVAFLSGASRRASTEARQTLEAGRDEAAAANPRASASPY